MVPSKARSPERSLRRVPAHVFPSGFHRCRPGSPPDRPRESRGSFQVSEFIYASDRQSARVDRLRRDGKRPFDFFFNCVWLRPPQQDSIFQLKMLLQPTVNITHARF